MFNSGVNSNSYGTYYHQHISIQLGQDSLPFDEIELQRFIEASPGVEEQLHSALEEIAILHEFRHFHDCFGTIAGISLFDSHIARLMAFAEICARLQRDAVSMRLPFLDWAKDRNCPDYVKVFIDRLQKGAYLERIFMGAIDVPRIPGIDDRSWVELPFPHGNGLLPAFPMAMRTGYETPDGNLHLDPGGSTKFVPIGFEALIEGNAQALQRSIIEGRWPTAVSKLFWNKTVVIRGSKGESLEDRPPLPYNVTDLLVSKFLRTKHGIEQFPRAWITKLADRALMIGHAPIHASQQTMIQPGGVFVTLLEEATWNADKSQIETTASMNSGEIAKLIDRITASVVAVPKSAASLGAIVQRMRSYVFDEIVIPLLKLRLEIGDILFCDHNVYLSNFRRLPMPPFMLTPSGFKGSGVTLLPMWTQFVLFSDLAQQIWSNQTILECGKAVGNLPELKQFELLPDFGCTAQLKKRNCLHWYPGRTTPMPPCVLRNIMLAIGLHGD
jgi:hypothetical protein